MPDLAALITLLGLAGRGRTQLAAENLAPRHQLAIYKRSVGRPNINDRDRVFWLTMMRMLREWRVVLVFVRVAAAVATPVLVGLHHRYSRAA